MVWLPGDQWKTKSQIKINVNKYGNIVIVVSLRLILTKNNSSCALDCTLPVLVKSFFKNSTHQTLIKKTFLEDPAFFLICFCSKDGTSSSKPVGWDKFFVRWKLIFFLKKWSSRTCVLF